MTFDITLAPILSGWASLLQGINILVPRGKLWIPFFPWNETNKQKSKFHTSWYTASQMPHKTHPLVEVFGFPVDNFSEEADRYRTKKLCPFNNKVPNCTKDKASDPL